MTTDLLRKAFEQVANDSDIVELAEWGIEDYAKIIAGTARSMGIDSDL